MLDSQLTKHRNRLADLLSFARERVPYYHDALPSNVSELVLDSRRWLQIPVLGKRPIQADWHSFLSQSDAADDPTIQILSTSGSTGTPLKIARSSSEMRVQTRRLWAARARWQPNIMRWKQLNLFHVVESPHLDVLPLGCDEYLDLSFEAMAGHARLIDAYQPDWMCGVPSHVYRLAQYYQREQRNIPTLKLIEVTAEELSYQRQLVEAVFGCPVVDLYGCREFWVLSYECPFRQMHAWNDDLLLEVIRDGQPVPPGETGELVVTSLTNRVMPLIRYELGDSVQMSPSSCPCGDPRPILTPVGGRTAGLIVTRDRVVTPAFLNISLGEFIRHHGQAILEYQIVQPDYDRLEIHVVPGESFYASATIKEVSRLIHDILPGVHCQFVVRSSIACLPSGKAQSFISRVDPGACLP